MCNFQTFNKKQSLLCFFIYFIPQKQKKIEGTFYDCIIYTVKKKQQLNEQRTTMEKSLFFKKNINIR